MCVMKILSGYHQILTTKKNRSVSAGEVDRGVHAGEVDRGRNFFSYQCSGMGRFQLLNLGGSGYGLMLWVVIAIIVSPTPTITLITTLTII